MTADVAGHDDDGVGKVDGVAVIVGQAAIIQYLKQNVVNVIVSFFDLVQQDHTVRTSPHRFGEFSALFVTDVPGSASISRLTLCRSMNSLILNAIIAFSSSNTLAARLCRFGFPDAGWAEEQEGPDRPMGILQTTATAANRIATALMASS